MEKGYECVNCHEFFSQEPLTVCQRCLLHKGIDPNATKLRDEVAMRAMQCELTWLGSASMVDCKLVAAHSYDLADAFMEARKR